MASDCTVQTNIGKRVTVTEPFFASGDSLKAILPGMVFQLREVRRNQTLGGYYAVIAEESRDSYMGLYTTPLSRCWRVPYSIVTDYTP